MAEGIRAIETSYAGCRFRSRLEARWAVFFDALGVSWEYEAQGFELTPVVATNKWDKQPNDHEHLGRYLPDFWLPSIATWFEVKGEKPAKAVSGKLFRFSRLLPPGQRLITAVGGVPDPTAFDISGHPSDGPFDIWLSGGTDYHYAWCLCPWCKKPGVEFDARGARVCGYQTHHPDDPGYEDKCYSGNAGQVLRAYVAARSARFEHGEQP